jgi:hypothetical protein
MPCGRKSLIDNTGVSRNRPQIAALHPQWQHNLRFRGDAVGFADLPRDARVITARRGANRRPERLVSITRSGPERPRVKVCAVFVAKLRR